MVVYIRKRLNIFVCIPSGAGAEGGRVGCMVSRMEVNQRSGEQLVPVRLMCSVGL